jgi:hypothetical protein
VLPSESAQLLRKSSVVGQFENPQVQAGNRPELADIFKLCKVILILCAFFRFWLEKVSQIGTKEVTRPFGRKNTKPHVFPACAGQKGVLSGLKSRFKAVSVAV